MRSKQQSVRFAVPLLIASLLVFVDVSPAQELPQSSPPQPRQSQPSGVMIDPSAGPLKPNDQPAQLPEAREPAATPPAPKSQSSRPQSPALPAVQQPLGAAAAEQVKTAGGGASRPAGNAIAPAKQHQYRSLLIKLGAVAAVGVAAGTVYGLSHATSSTPPHSTVAAAK